MVLAKRKAPVRPQRKNDQPTIRWEAGSTKLTGRDGEGSPTPKEWEFDHPSCEQGPRDTDHRQKDLLQTEGEGVGDSSQ